MCVRVCAWGGGGGQAITVAKLITLTLIMLTGVKMPIANCGQSWHSGFRAQRVEARRAAGSAYSCQGGWADLADSNDATSELADGEHTALIVVETGELPGAHLRMAVGARRVTRKIDPTAIRFLRGKKRGPDHAVSESPKSGNELLCSCTGAPLAIESHRKFDNTERACAGAIIHDPT